MLLGTVDVRGKETPLPSVIESFLLSGHGRAASTQRWYRRYLADYCEWLGRNEREVVVGSIDPMLVNAYVGERRQVSQFTARAACVTLMGKTA